MREIKIQNKNYRINATPEYGSEVFDPNIELINNFIKDLKIPQGVIIDIGANQGIVSILLKDNILNNGVICIEPALKNVEYLKNNIPEAKIYSLAISNTNTTGSLSQNGSNNDEFSFYYLPTSFTDLVNKPLPVIGLANDFI